MRVVVVGENLPGRSWGGQGDVHVALQVRADPEKPVPGDAPAASWETEVRVVDGDFRGPAVHGRRGERFLYLTWGDVGTDGSWQMFRRAKLMLTDLDGAQVAEAESTGRAVVATVQLTDEAGCPRCGRLRAPAITWSLG